MHFAYPYLLLLLTAVPLLILWRWRQQRRRPAASLTLSTVALFQGLRPSWRVRLRPLLALLRLAAVALVVVAAARPQHGRAAASVEAQGIDVALALDASRSMTDSRLSGRSSLTVAKEVAAEFVRNRLNDRVGLVIFEGESRIMSPLTLDRVAVAELVQRVESGALSGGTAIGLAMADGINLVRESQARSRIVILVTDGENNQHEIEPLAAARIAQALKIRVYTIGILARSSQGAPSVDEEALREIARLTDARYYRATDASSLSSIYNDVDRLEKSRLGQESFTAYDELAAYFLGPALALLLLEVGLASTLFRRVP